MDTTRRRFIAAGGLAAVLGTTGLAGCSGFLGGGGGSLESWQYDPTTLSDTPNVLFGSMRYGDLYEMRDEFPQSMQDDFEVDDSDTPVQAGDIGTMVGVGGGDVSQQMQSTSFFGSFAVTGSFDRQAMVDEVESDSEVSSAGEYEGYAMYEVPELSDAPVGSMGQAAPQGSATVGVSESALVFGIGVAQNSDLDVTGTQAAETMIDAGAGNAQKLSGSSGPAQDVQSRVTDKHIAVGAEVDPALVDMAERLSGMGAGGTGSGGATMLGGLRAGGFGADITPDTTTYTFVIRYESASSAEESGVADLVSGMSSRFEQQPQVDSVSATQDGSTVVVEIAGPTEQILEQGPGAGGTPLNVAPPTR